MLLSRRYLVVNKNLSICFRFNSSEQIDYLKSAISNGHKDWTDVKENLLKRRGHCNEKNIDAMMLKVMVTSKEFDAALTFADYLKANSTDLSLGAINGLLILYYNYSQKNELSNQEKDFILNSYNMLYKKYKTLDFATAENLLHALCAVDEWKKCIKILEDIKLSDKPTHSAYSSLISTLFKVNKKAEAMKMISISVNDKRPLQDKVYEEWIKYIYRKYKDKKTILKYLDEICSHISNTGMPVTEVTANNIKEAYLSIQWETSFSQIYRKNGECISCHKKLECLKLTEEEFKLLQANVKDKLIVGTDLFLKTLPEELERFQKFVNQTAPYDIVLDALNLSYLANRSVKDRLHILKRVVNYFVDKNMKILLLGRKHMLTWNRGGLEYLMKRCVTFFTEDLSQDDPYFISAAILSGPHTDIVSRDLFRGHRFVMKDDNLRMIFQRWQWQHQWKVYSTKRGPSIQSPLVFTPCAQRNSGIWHIPYEAENTSNEGKVHDGVPDCSTWLCLRPKS